MHQVTRIPGSVGESRPSGTSSAASVSRPAHQRPIAELTRRPRPSASSPARRATSRACWHVGGRPPGRGRSENAARLVRARVSGRGGRARGRSRPPLQEDGADAGGAEGVCTPCPRAASAVARASASSRASARRSISPAYWILLSRSPGRLGGAQRREPARTGPVPHRPRRRAPATSVRRWPPPPRRCCRASSSSGPPPHVPHRRGRPPGRRARARSRRGHGPRRTSPRPRRRGPRTGAGAPGRSSPSVWAMASSSRSLGLARRAHPPRPDRGPLQVGAGPWRPGRRRRGRGGPSSTASRRCWAMTTAKSSPGSGRPARWSAAARCRAVRSRRDWVAYATWRTTDWTNRYWPRSELNRSVCSVTISLRRRDSSTLADVLGSGRRPARPVPRR